MQPIKYALVGLANTAITAIIIFVCMTIGLSLYYSNTLGYIIGINFRFSW
ncbi:GtrA family protein [Erwinia billingiae]